MTIVGVAFTGADALRDYEQLRPDVTFLDVDLGSESGIAVAELLHRTSTAPRPPVILISIHDERELAAVPRRRHVQVALVPPIEVIGHAVGLYHRFALSLRDVEELMLARGVAVTYETIRSWCAKFGPDYAGPVTSAATPPRRQVALGRGVRADQRHHPLPVARGRPARHRARHLGAVAPQRGGGQAVFPPAAPGSAIGAAGDGHRQLASYQVAARELLPSVTHRRWKYLTTGPRTPISRPGFGNG